MGSMDVTGRFWTKVSLPPIADQRRSCWMWTAYRNPDGYGQFRVGGRTVYAHRFAYELMVGPIPDGLQIDHLCRVRACVNPSHMEPVTPKMNTRRGETGAVRGAQQRAKTHCPQGHPYAGANLYVHKRGDRDCRICMADRSRRYMAKKVAITGTVRPRG